jgi:hypothetical protein
MEFRKYTIEEVSIYEKHPHYHIFKMSPTGFGITWAEDQIKSLIPFLSKPNDSHCDFLFDGYKRLEIKSSRAVDYEIESKVPLYEKALSIKSSKPFLMNFQQLKTEYCDVFIWIGVWSDIIKYWVMSSNEVKELHTTKQHAGPSCESQFFLTTKNISQFDKYLIDKKDLTNAIHDAYDRQIKQSGEVFRKQRTLMDFVIT